MSTRPVILGEIPPTQDVPPVEVPQMTAAEMPVEARTEDDEPVMTWAEFKRLAEAQGLRDEDPVYDIDIWNREFKVRRRTDGNISIY